MISKDKRHVAENLSDFLVIKDANSLLYDLTTNYAFTYKLKTFIISFFFSNFFSDQISNYMSADNTDTPGTFKSLFHSLSNRFF